MELSGFATLVESYAVLVEAEDSIIPSEIRAIWLIT